MHKEEIKIENLYKVIAAKARNQPLKKAIKIHQYLTNAVKWFTYGDLLKDIDKAADELAARFNAKDKVLVAVPVSYELYVISIACFKIGVTAVLLNPGMNKKYLARAFKEIEAAGIISYDKILSKRWFFPAFRFLPKKISINKKRLGIDLLQSRTVDSKVFKPIEEDIALITYTSGSSGMPKAVVRTYKTLYYQLLFLNEEMGNINKEDGNATVFLLFPVVVLRELSVGNTICLPHIDFKNVLSISPKETLQIVVENETNMLYGPPAFFNQLANSLLKNEKTVDRKYYFVLGGAPVSEKLSKKIEKAFPNSKIMIVYGSSEAEPIACRESTKTVEQKQGYCVGKITSNAKVRFLSLYDENTFVEEQKGEIVVSGSHVCEKYWKNPEADKKNKIKDAEGTIWHKTGDVGFICENGYLWLTSRRESLITFQDKKIGSFELELNLQNKFNLSRTAVVQKRKDSKVIVFLTDDRQQKDIEAIRSYLAKTYGLEIQELRYVREMPVDGRHHSKTNYPYLKTLIK